MKVGTLRSTPKPEGTPPPAEPPLEALLRFPHPKTVAVADADPPADDAMPAEAGDDQHFVYIVECADGTYYTGYTTDVDRRVAEHNAGTGAKYTQGRRPVELVHTEAYASQSAAMQREYAIKQRRRAAKEQLVQDNSAEGRAGDEAGD